MKVKLKEGRDNNYLQPFDSILTSSGINNIIEYITLDQSATCDYRYLDNIALAAQLCQEAILEKKHIHLIVDSDADGYLSSSMLYHYLLVKCKHPIDKLTFSIHTKKQHGITEDITIAQNIDLLIIPDAGTDNLKQAQELSNAMKHPLVTICLDHHNIQALTNVLMADGSRFCVVNNQLSQHYTNKELSGAGITYKFIQALSDCMLMDKAYAENYLDMVSFAQVADVMDIRSYETRYYIQKGLKQIKNRLLQAMIKAESYNIPDGTDPNPIDIGFYIIPKINAVIRCGTIEEKTELFMALAQCSNYEPKSKPPSTRGVMADFYDYTVKKMEQIKRQQDKKVNANIERIENEQKIMQRQDLFVVCEEWIEPSLTGLIANKLSYKYHMPFLVLRKTKDLCSGSGRNANVNMCADFNSYCKTLDLFQKIAGHDNAFGAKITPQNYEKLIQHTTTDIHIDDTVYVDFIIPANEFDGYTINKINQLKPYYGKNIEQVRVCITDVPVNPSQIHVIGKSLNTWSYEDDKTHIKYLKFNFQNDELVDLSLDQLDQPQYINIIGDPSINQYKGIITPQVVIQQYEMIEREVQHD